MKLFFLLILPIFLFSNISIINKNEVKNKNENDHHLYIKKVLKENSDSKYYQNYKIKSYYKYNKYELLWTNAKGLNDLAFDLLERIKDDPVLKPKIKELFYINKIKILNKQIINDNKINLFNITQVDFILTSTYIKYMKYLSSGTIKWKEYKIKIHDLEKEEEITRIWEKYSNRINIRKLLYKAIKKEDINFAIKKVDTNFHNYEIMREYLSYYENIKNAGGFLKIKTFKKYPKLNDESLNIRKLKQRLVQNKDIIIDSCINEYNSTYICSALFDEETKKAIKIFQENLGLEVDGLAGKRTISALNITVSQRIEQMRINIERMRWLPRSLGEKHLLVNIPDYSLKMYDKKDVKLDMDVIIGKKEFPTPIFSNKMTYVVLNPYWRIPQKIVKNEIIPQLVIDEEYLEKENIKIFETWDHESNIIDSKLIDWNMYLDNDLIGSSIKAPMRFIQLPSEENALGKMKFMFPNKYSIYLHDTPSKYLFKYRTRAFSHGCVRLKNPNLLLETLSSFNDNINIEKSQKILEENEKKSFNLNKKLPIHLVYLTSWVNEKGLLQFRDDIYDYDKIQIEFLYKKSKFKELVSKK